jgi:hypothetical protein
MTRQPSDEFSSSADRTDTYVAALREIAALTQEVGAQETSSRVAPSRPSLWRADAELLKQKRARDPQS